MILSSEFLQKLERLSLVLRRTRNRQLAGSRESYRLGAGLEFHDFAPYQPGDDYRYVDWSLYARLGQLFLKLFVEEHDTNIHLLVDGSRSMSFHPQKAELAAQLAAAFGYISLRQLDGVSAAYMTDRITTELPARRGRPQIFRLLQFLEKGPESGMTDMARVLARFAYYHKRPGLLVICSDFFCDSDFPQLIRNLVAARWQIVLVQVLSPEEARPQLEQPLVLVDSESGERVLVDAEGLTERYRDRLERFQRQLASMMAFGVHYIPVSTDDSVEDIVFRAFREQGVVR